MMPAPMTLRFQDLHSFTAADVEAAIRRNDRDELPLVPVTIALLAAASPAALDFCIRLARHDDPRVRGNAILAIGHLARRFRDLDERRVKPLLEAALRDPDATVRNHAKSAADEVYQFLHWTMDGHIYG